MTNLNSYSQDVYIHKIEGISGVFYKKQNGVLHIKCPDGRIFYAPISEFIKLPKIWE